MAVLFRDKNLVTKQVQILKGDSAMRRDDTPERGKIIQLNEEAIRDHLGEMVRSTVEETLNRMLDSEAERLCNAEKYQRSDARKDTRAGHYERQLHTRAGEVRLKVPKLRQQTFETAIIERYRRSIQSGIAKGFRNWQMGRGRVALLTMVTAQILGVIKVVNNSTL